VLKTWGFREWAHGFSPGFSGLILSELVWKKPAFAVWISITRILVGDFFSLTKGCAFFRRQWRTRAIFSANFLLSANEMD
jgi:hypothetical protein